METGTWPGWKGAVWDRPLKQEGLVVTSISSPEAKGLGLLLRPQVGSTRGEAGAAGPREQWLWLCTSAPAAASLPLPGPRDGGELLQPRASRARSPECGRAGAEPWPACLGRLPTELPKALMSLPVTLQACCLLQPSHSTGALQKALLLGIWGGTRLSLLLWPSPRHSHQGTL